MSKTWMAIILAGSFTIVGSPLRLAQAMPDDEHHEGFSVDKRLERMTKELNLTPEQQSSIRSILEEKKSKMDALHQQMKTLRDETHQKISSVLNDPQKTKFEKMKKDMEGKKHHRHKEHKEEEHHSH